MFLREAMEITGYCVQQFFFYYISFLGFVWVQILGVKTYQKYYSSSYSSPNQFWTPMTIPNKYFSEIPVSMKTMYNKTPAITGIFQVITYHAICILDIFKIFLVHLIHNPNIFYLLLYIWLNIYVYGLNQHYTAFISSECLEIVLSFDLLTYCQNHLGNILII